MNKVSDVATEMGLGMMSFMAHLPHYAQLDEDFAGTSRMLEVLSAFYDVPANLVPTHRGKLQYAEIDAAVERKPEHKALVSRLEAFYDSTYPVVHSESGSSGAPDEDPPTLSPEIEQFLKDLDLGGPLGE